ncbi:MAG: TonB-dependent receptor, partial [Stellaceae bacterium]
ACAGGGLLCQSDWTTPLTSATGATIPDLSLGGTIPIGQNDLETIHTVTWGGSLQTSYTGALFGHDNHFVLGGSADRSHTDFQTATELGIIDPFLQVLNSGIFVDTPESAGFDATPVSLGADNDYYGIFASDTLNLTPALAVTASGRYNIADISLADQRGAALSGSASYSRFNPAIGATYKFGPGLTAYAGYSEGNRVPTPSEIECSNPAQPCLLPSSLASDPPGLKQVVSHTYEAGLRGRFTLPERLPGRFGWHFGLYRTDLDDDIYGVATSISSGYFANIGATRRQGIETGITYKDAKWSVFGNYSLVDATFESSFLLPSPANPSADASGSIAVRTGDRLPGIPMNQFKVGADYRITPHWSVGAALSYFSGQYLRGDESNQNAMLPGYEVINLHSTYTVIKNVQVFFNVQNILNAKYVTFGQYGDASGINAPGVPAGGGTSSRFLAPASPLAMVGGIRIRF